MSILRHLMHAVLRTAVHNAMHRPRVVVHVHTLKAKGAARPVAVPPPLPAQSIQPAQGWPKGTAAWATPAALPPALPAQASARPRRSRAKKPRALHC